MAVTCFTFLSNIFVSFFVFENFDVFDCWAFYGLLLVTIVLVAKNGVDRSVSAL